MVKPIISIIYYYYQTPHPETPHPRTPNTSIAVPDGLVPRTSQSSALRADRKEIAPPRGGASEKRGGLAYIYIYIYIYIHSMYIYIYIYICLLCT